MRPKRGIAVAAAKSPFAGKLFKRGAALFALEFSHVFLFIGYDMMRQTGEYLGQRKRPAVKG